MTDTISFLLLNKFSFPLSRAESHRHKGEHLSNDENILSRLFYLVYRTPLNSISLLDEVCVKSFMHEALVVSLLGFQRLMTASVKGRYRGIGFKRPLCYVTIILFHKFFCIYFRFQQTKGLTLNVEVAEQVCSVSIRFKL